MTNVINTSIYARILDKNDKNSLNRNLLLTRKWSSYIQAAFQKFVIFI